MKTFMKKLVAKVATPLLIAVSLALTLMSAPMSAETRMLDGHKVEFDPGCSNDTYLCGASPRVITFKEFLRGLYYHPDYNFEWFKEVNHLPSSVTGDSKVEPYIAYITFDLRRYVAMSE
jgi:hypothetical protein